ncbi:MAG: AarF/UbiB family protein [Pseudomonadota bacterium]
MASLVGDLWRMAKAGVTLARHDVILPGEYQARMPAPARWAGKTLRAFGGGAKGRPGERLATALESLGPAYIKLGQFLATRPDVFGVEATQDLSRLKDKLPPFSGKAAKDTLETEFGADVANRMFPDLGPAVAAASIAQVHKIEVAGKTKAVKILRPGIERQIDQALSAMQRGAKLVETASADSRRLEPVAFTTTVGNAMVRELDLRLEAGGLDEMGEISRKTGHFIVPQVDWERTGRRVLTMEWLDGVPLTDPAALSAEDIDPVSLANDVTRGFLTHAIVHGVFHADMHEGNLMVLPGNKLGLLDFGIIGRIGLMERRFLAEILFGFIRRDYTRIAEVHFEAGYVPKDQSVGQFAQALRSVGEPIHGKEAEDVSMGRLLLQLLDYTHTFGMRLRPELVLLQKTMVQVEGVARAIDPGHNIWDAAEPVVEKWVREELGPAGAVKLAARNAREVSDRLKRLPDVMDKVEAMIEAGAHQPETDNQRFAPWWGWFGLILGLGALAVWGLA